MKKIAIAFILFIIHTNISFAQSSDYDTLRKEVRKLLWKVEYNFQENYPIWSRNELINRSAKGYIDFYSLAIVKDTINRVQFDVQIGYYTPKEMREKIKFFRENIISVLDELAAENKWTKKYEDRNLDKRQKRELGFMRSYDYYESTTGRKIISIFDRQKMNMELNIYGYPIKNMAEYRSKKELENLAFERISKIISDKLEADLGGYPRYREYKNTITTQKKAIKASDFDDAMRKGGVHYDKYSTTNYIIVAYGFNLTDVKAVGRETKEDEKTTQIFSFRDETESYSKEDKRIETAVKLYNLKIYLINMTTSFRNFGILGVSNKDYEKMAVEAWVNPIKK